MTDYPRGLSPVPPGPQMTSTALAAVHSLRRHCALQCRWEATPIVHAFAVSAAASQILFACRQFFRAELVWFFALDAARLIPGTCSALDRTPRVALFMTTNRTGQIVQGRGMMYGGRVADL